MTSQRFTQPHQGTARARGVRFLIALADLGYEAYPITFPPIDWRDRFTRAHGYHPPFNAGEMAAPWCPVCCDFHFPSDECSTDQPL